MGEKSTLVDFFSIECRKINYTAAKSALGEYSIKALFSIKVDFKLTVKNVIKQDRGVQFLNRKL